MSSPIIPNITNVDTLTPFRYFCQRVLPAVYDNSLSYYELLCKVTEYLNQTMSNVNDLSDNFSTLYEWSKQLQNWIDSYFDNLNIQEEINNKLDQMAESGQLLNLIEQYLPKYANGLMLANVCPRPEENANDYYLVASYDGLGWNPVPGTYQFAGNVPMGKDSCIYLVNGTYIITASPISGQTDDVNVVFTDDFEIFEYKEISVGLREYCQAQYPNSGSWIPWAPRLIQDKDGNWFYTASVSYKEREDNTYYPGFYNTYQRQFIIPITINTIDRTISPNGSISEIGFSSTPESVIDFNCFWDEGLNKYLGVYKEEISFITRIAVADNIAGPYIDVVNSMWNLPICETPWIMKEEGGYKFYSIHYSDAYVPTGILMASSDSGIDDWNPPSYTTNNGYKGNNPGIYSKTYRGLCPIYCSQALTQIVLGKGFTPIYGQRIIDPIVKSITDNSVEKYNPNGFWNWIDVIDYRFTTDCIIDLTGQSFPFQDIRINVIPQSEPITITLKNNGANDRILQFNSPARFIYNKNTNDNLFVNIPFSTETAATAEENGLTARLILNKGGSGYVSIIGTPINTDNTDIQLELPPYAKQLYSQSGGTQMYPTENGIGFMNASVNINGLVSIQFNETPISEQINLSIPVAYVPYFNLAG